MDNNKLKSIFKDQRFDAYHESLDHTKVIEILSKNGGKLEYMGTFTINDALVACYRNYEPNKELGHKDIVMVQPFGVNNIVIGAMDIESFKKYSKIAIITCPECKDIVYSQHRHDYRPCNCGAVAIDGGSDYVRVIGSDKYCPVACEVNLLDIYKDERKKWVILKKE